MTIKAAEPGRLYVVEVLNKRQGTGNYAGVIDLFTTTVAPTDNSGVRRAFPAFSGKPLTTRVAQASSLWGRESEELAIGLEKFKLTL